MQITKSLGLSVVNDYFYCKRRAWYHTSGGIHLTDNLDLIEGKFLHKQLDLGQPFAHSRNHLISSLDNQTVNISTKAWKTNVVVYYNNWIGRIDAVEEIIGEPQEKAVISVKKGKSMLNTMAWLNDAIEAKVYAKAYEKTYSELVPWVCMYYHGNRTRIWLANDMTVQEVEYILQSIEEVITSNLLPERINSPKCIRCSVNPICKGGE